MRNWRFTTLTWLCGVMLCPALLADVPRADYQQRVQEAAYLANRAVDDVEQQNADTITKLARLLPPAEDVTDGTQHIQVDNAWFHIQLAQLPQTPSNEDEDDDEADALAKRWEQLAGYLTALNTRVNDVSAPLPKNFQLEQTKLNDILARSEYKTEERQTSGIQHWLRQQWLRLVKWLRVLLNRPGVEPSLPGQRVVTVARIIIIALLVIALAIALYQFARWWGRRQTTDKKEKSREILGVEITDETTTEDLLAAARALAQQGDYRGAIRRTYIALLYELEQRDKLRLHRSKTNRDYLDALRHETGLYPSFAVLTQHFERVWYGQMQASQFDFEGFLNGYTELVKSE